MFAVSLWALMIPNNLEILLLLIAKKVELCRLDRPEVVTWYSGSLSSLYRECPS